MINFFPILALSIMIIFLSYGLLKELKDNTKRNKESFRLFCIYLMNNYHDKIVNDSFLESDKEYIYHVYSILESSFIHSEMPGYIESDEFRLSLLEVIVKIAEILEIQDFVKFINDESNGNINYYEMYYDIRGKSKFKNVKHKWLFLNEGLYE